MLVPLLMNVFAVVLALALTFFTYFQWRFQYWKRKNVPFLPPQIPTGNIQSPLKQTETLGVQIQHLYFRIKAHGWKHCGMYFFAQPRYVVTDLDYLKSILTKDFQHFTDRGIYVNEKVDPIGAHLFAIGGTKWRNLRSKLTPTFSSGKLKNMFQTLVDCESSLQRVMAAKLKNGSAIDIKEILSCFATDIIGSCAFGLDCNTFKEEDSPFRQYGKRIFASNKIRLVAAAFPSLGKALGIRQVPKDISDFFTGIVKDTVEYRERNRVTRKDFLQMLLELKTDQKQNDGKSLTIDEIISQCFIFFGAGFDTSSSTMTFTLYELARHPDIQDKVREEVLRVLAKHDGQITYDSISDMTYMNQVIDEALRIYPPVSFITRVCVKDYKVPDEDVVIEAGTNVIVPIMGIHHDPSIYPDPSRFDPERFNEDNKKSRHQYAYLPFGEGPRVCIGMRFGLMQSKVGLTSLLRDYKFTVNAKTMEPLRMSVKSLVLSVHGEVWLNAEKVTANSNKF